ncbi:tRNA lysidine(34) synthetase TilS [Halopseudomonas pelagia]|uniref:tRNA lysidine(34) synthetase TilS n=1 Tax=Halopseudomonas pelagia TaxID=553151 RepID=UPI0003A4FDF6|nr:tRNA lysidine(34) synthetase TilS [Halopseudomonas pelagia]
MFSSQELLRQLLPCTDAPAWWLGLSGGMDSMVLLDALAELRNTHSLPPIKALHIHHGLHVDADLWTEHCEQQCRARGVELVVERVQLALGASIEAQARAARYQAFAAHMGSADCLLLAHHQDDQLETLLFRMLRGTGLRGLAGMPQARPLAQGRLFRPLLGWSRAQLLVWAESRQLCWIEDPANRDERFARTLLRYDLLPCLAKKWPAAPSNLLQLAEHTAEANLILDERAEQDLELARPGVTDPWLRDWQSLDATYVQALSIPRQSNLLRYWCRLNQYAPPPRRQLQAFLGQLAASSTGQPEMRVDDYRLCRSSGRLWLLPDAIARPPVPQTLGTWGDTPLAAGNGRLLIRPAEQGVRWFAGDWHIAYRQGGEQIKLPGRPTQPLKDLLQQAGIPSWLRIRVPLLYCDEQLVSVAGRWNAQEASASGDETAFQITWVPLTD